MIDRLCPFAELEAVTHELVVSIGFGEISVRPLPARVAMWNYGDAWPSARLVRYAPRAPLYAVAHEVAHLLAPDDGHGPMWQAQFARLAASLC